MLLATLVAGANAWQPCGAIPSTHCQSHDFSSLVGTAAVEVGLASGAAGAWRVANSTLFEESRTHNGSGSEYEAACVRELGAVRYIDPPFPLSDLFEARVKVRITADGGGLAGFLFSDKSQGTYYRWQLNSQPACNESALVFRFADNNMVPTDLSTTVATRSVAARRNEWYELRIYISYVDAGTGGAYNLFSIEQNPVSVPATLNNEVAGTAPTISAGTKLGLWCSARGSTGGCEFRDFVIVAKSLRDKLVGPLDCNACNLQFDVGQSSWCRCCDQQCGGIYTQQMCVDNNFCASECLAAKSCNGTTVATKLTTATTKASTAPTTAGSTTSAAPGDSTTSAAPGDSTTSAATGGDSGSTSAAATGADSSTGSAAPGDSTAGASTASNTDGDASTTSAAAQIVSSAATIGATAAAMLAINFSK
jgi:hypothetical protein